MKKFTNFLLTFLFFIGFIYVYAQKPDEGGPSKGTPETMTVVADGNIFCKGGLVEPPSSVGVQFQIITSGDPYLIPQAGWSRSIFYKADDDPWVEITESDPLFKPGEAYGSFGFQAPFSSVTDSLLVYGVFLWEEDPIYSETIRLDLLDAPPIVFIPRSVEGMICEMGTITIDASSTWPSLTAQMGAYGLDPILTYTWYLQKVDVESDDYTLGEHKIKTFDTFTAGLNEIGFGLKVQDFYLRPVPTCDVYDSLLFTVYPLPTPQITGNGIVCEGDDAYITVGVTFNNPDNDTVQLKFELFQDDVLVETIFSPFFDGDNPISFDSTSSFTLPGGTYEFYTKLTVINKSGIPSGCVANSATLTVKVIPPSPVIVSIDDAEMCAGDPIYTIQTTVSGGIEPYTYYWKIIGAGDFALGSDSFDFNPTTAGVYKVVVRVDDADPDRPNTACAPSVDTATITVYKTPTKAYTHIQTPVVRCEDPLTNDFTFNMIATIPNYAESETGLWILLTPEKAIIDDVTDPFTDIKVNAGDTATVVWMISSGSNALCGISTDTLTMIVVPLPEIIVDLTAEACLDGELIIAPTFNATGALDTLCTWTGFAGTATDCEFEVNTSIPGTGTLTLAFKELVDISIDQVGNEHKYYCSVTVDIEITIYDEFIVTLPMPSFCCDAERVALTTGTQEDKDGEPITGGTFKYVGDKVEYDTDDEIYYYYPAATGDHMVRYYYKDEHGCEYADSLYFECNVVPMIQTNSPLIICANDLDVLIQISIHASSPEPYVIVWSGYEALAEGEFVDSLTYKFNPSKATSNDTLYINVAVTDANGCSMTDTIIVQINPIPELIVPGPLSVCSNSEALEIELQPVQENVIHSYTVTTPETATGPGTVLPAEETKNYIIPFDPADYVPIYGFGTYKILVAAVDTLTDCASAVDTIEVTIFEKPVLTPLRDTIVCVGDPLEMITWAGYTSIVPPGYIEYEHGFRFTPLPEQGGLDGWENYNISFANRFSVIVDTDYPGAALLEIFITDDNGCVDTAKAFIRVMDRPIVSVPNLIEECQDPLDSLRVAATVVKGTPGYQFEWRLESAKSPYPLTFNSEYFFDYTADPVGSVILIPKVDHDTIWAYVSLYDNLAGQFRSPCPSNIDSVLIIIHPLPTQASAEFQWPVCADPDGTYTFSLDANEPDTLLGETGAWTIINGIIADADKNKWDGAEVTVQAGDTAMAIWTIYAGFEDCGSTSDTIYLIVYELPVVSVADTVGVCFRNYLPITATATGGNPDPTAGYTYTWTPQWSQLGTASGDTFTVDATTNPAGEYWIYVTASDGTCTSLPDTVIVIIRVLPNVQIAMRPNIVCANIDSVEITGGTQVDPYNNPIPGGTFSYEIVLQPGQTDTAEIVQHGDKFYFKPHGVVANYTIRYTFTDDYGCSRSATQRMTVVAVPVVEISPTQGNHCEDGIYVVNANLTTSGKPDYIYTWIPDGFTGAPLSDTTSNTSSEFYVNTSTAVTGKLFVYVTDDNGCISDMDSTNIVVYPNPKIDSLTLDVKPCAGQVANLKAHIDSTGGITLQWYFYIQDALLNPNDWFWPYGSGRHTEPTLIIPGYNGPILYRVVATSPRGCRDTAEFYLEPADPPVTNVVIETPCEICNNSITTLKATVTADPQTEQTYEWYMISYANGSDCLQNALPVKTEQISALTNLSYGTYRVEADHGVNFVKFMLITNTVGYNCPDTAYSCCVEVLPALKITGGGNDTICHGGSVDISFAISDFKPVSLNGNRIFYRWRENNLYHSNVSEIYMLELGLTDISFTTYPGLHTSENGPQSYCYSVEVWEGTPSSTLASCNCWDFTDVCHVFSDCHYVTVLKDPVVTISGPYYIPKLPTENPQFVANVVGGYENPTYTWYLNGYLDPTQTGKVYTLTDEDVLGTIGNYDIAVKVGQDHSGCEAPLVVHEFQVGCPTGTVTIAGLTEGCVGDRVILTAIVESDAVDFILKWKVDGQYVGKDLTYEFIVPDNIDRVDIQVEVSFCGCEMVYSPVHYFQVLPKPVVEVENYIICENGAVEVEAVVYNFGEGQIYRYLWYDDPESEDPIGITYSNHRLFTYAELKGASVATFYVKVQMLNAVCSSEFADFTITVQGSLEPVTITPSDAIACTGALVFFELAPYPGINAELFGEPEISWWIDGIQVPGEGLQYLNIAFEEVGTHYMYARLVYPGNNCEYVTDSVTILIFSQPTVAIYGNNVFCAAEAVEVSLTAQPLPSDPINDPYYNIPNEEYQGLFSYRWFLDGVEQDGNDFNNAFNLEPRTAPYIFKVFAYIIDQQNSNCGAWSDEFVVNVNLNPVVGITADKTKVCENEIVKLTAEISFNAEMTYQWYTVEEGVLVPIPGADATIYYVTPSATTVYAFTASYNNAVCDASSNIVTVTVVETPVISLDIANNASHICQGGPVVLEATYYAGGVYTWYENGIVIEGAVTHKIVVFPQAQNGLVTAYNYTAIVTVDPGCVSDLDKTDGVDVVVNPELMLLVEGNPIVCENTNVVLNGFVFNHDPATGALNYKWIIPGVVGIPVDVEPYLLGFVELYNAQYESLLEDGYVADFTATHPVLPNTADSWNLSVPSCTGGTGLNAMYNIGAGDATVDGIEDATMEAKTAADQFIASLEQMIIDQATMDAVADANIANTLISYAEGAAKGYAYANVMVTEPFKESFVAAVPPYNFGSITAPDPEAGTYQPAYWLTPGFTCLTGIPQQFAAYKAGYHYGYWLAYGETFTELYYKEVLEGLTTLYTQTYSDVFDATYDLYTYVMDAGAYIPGSVEDDGILLNKHLPARPYPYHIYLLVEGENGCVSMSDPFIVNVYAAPVLQAITFDPEPFNGIICDGGQVTITAHVDKPEEVDYYIWYVNGFEIEGDNLATILVSPLTVDGDPTDYVYNVRAVPFGEECISELNEDLARTLTVIRNPIIELHGQHHVCDIYSEGGEAQDTYDNVFITAKFIGTDPFNPIYPMNPEYFTWYLNGTPIYDYKLQFQPEYLIIYLSAKPEPYLIKLVYDAPYGCFTVTEDFEVYVHPQPVVNITATESEICSGGSVTLRANLDNYVEQDYLYQWYIHEPKDYIINDNNDTIWCKIPGATTEYYTTPALNEFGVNGKEVVTYWVSVQQITTSSTTSDTITCFVHQMFDLTVYPKPIIDSIRVSVDNVCSGGQVTVTAYPNENNLGELPVYTWKRNGEVIPGVYGHTFTQTLWAEDDDVTVYTYNAILSYEPSGCDFYENPDLEVSVTAYRNPIVVISGDANICETEFVFLKASVDHSSDTVGILSYTWYESGEERVIDPLLVGPSGQFYAEYWPPRYEPYMFTVEVTRGNGCTSFSDPFYVYVHELPVVNITASEQTICEGGCVTLDANLNDYNTDNIIFQWYKWEYTEYTLQIGDVDSTFIDSARVLIPGATERLYPVCGLTETSKFEVEVIQTHSLCVATDIIWINVTPIPVVHPNPVVVETICEGDQFTLNVFTTLEDEIITDVIYKWFENGTEIEGATLPYYAPIYLTPGDYTYQVQAILPISGCVSELTLVGVITVKAEPIVYIEGTQTVCNAVEPTYLHAVVAPTGATVTYQWTVLHNGEETELGTEPYQVVSNVPSPYQYIYVVEVTDIESGCVVKSVAYPVTVELLSNLGATADKTEICAGETVTLTAIVPEGENFEFQWFADGTEIDGANAQVLYVNPIVSTIYTFKAIQVVSGCVRYSNEVPITVIAPPTIIVENVVEETICKGEQATFGVTLISDDEVTYTWYVNGVKIDGAELDVLTYLFNQAGTFKFEVSATSQIAGCTSELEYAGTIVVKDAPTVVIDGPTLVCNAAEPTYLYADVDPSNATVTYQWFESYDGVTIAKGTEPTQIVNNVPSSIPYIYIVEIFDYESECIVKSLAHIVYVEEHPVIGITANKTEVCAGEAVTLTANASESSNMVYQWYEIVDGEPVAIAGAVAPIYYAYPTETTIYAFTATENGSECVATSNIVTVVVISKPVISITPIVETICQGDQVTFATTIEPGVAVTYNWFINGQKVENAELSLLTYLFTQPGVFVVEVSATSLIAGCTSDMVYAGTITVKAAPSVEITGPTVVCNMVDPTTLYAEVDPTNATVSYQWYESHDGITVLKGTAPTQLINQTPSAIPYIYVVEITDYESGCVVKSLAHTVYVDLYPVIGISADKTEICAGETVKLTADISESNNMIYQWYADHVAIPNANAPILYVYPNTTTVYTFIATQIGTDCFAPSNEVTVTVVTVPVLTTEPIVATICLGEQITFEVMSTNPAVEYTWYIDGVAINGANIEYLTYLFETQGTFVFEVSAKTLIAGCIADKIYAGTITVKAPPAVVISGTNSICDATVPMYLFANVTPPNAPVTYQWYVIYPGETTETALGTEQSQLIINTPHAMQYDYKVVVTDILSGCVTVSDIHTVNVNLYSNLAINVDKLEACYGSSFTFNALIETHVNWTYQWYHNGQSMDNETFIVMTTVPVPGVHSYYFVATETGTGCTATSNTININVKPIPDAPVLTIAPNKICTGDPVTISGNVAGTYEWFKNGFTIATGANQSFIDQPTANNILTTYYYTAIVTVNGCPSELATPVSVQVHPQISVSIAGANEVCEQALEGQQLPLHALVTGLQTGVSYQYVWYYRQGNNPAVPFYDDINNPYAVVPNNLPANDAAAPYCFTVEVTVVDYGCTATSACHEVNILIKPTVEITLDNYEICLEGYVVATAQPTPAATPENPYNYIWTVNGQPLAYNQPTITIANNLLIGVNEICVTIERAYGSMSCFGATCVNMNVLTAPSLALSQNIAGLQLPGMCTGGEVNLFAQIVDFDVTLIDISEFTYQWRRNGQPIVAPYNFYSDVLNNIGIYNYEVKASINSSLGCATPWTAFNPVEVVAQPTVSIHTKDYTLFEVCEGAVIEINNVLGIVNSNIQGGWEYKWNDMSEWIPFTNQIDPRTVEFNTTGTRTFFLNASFTNPTCNDITSNQIQVKVVNDPIWKELNINPSIYEGLCLGEVITLNALFSGGVSDGSNDGKIQWFYKLDDEQYVELPGPGGNKVHKPAQEGAYTYMATYIAAHELSGCDINPAEFGPMIVEESITPAAWWVANVNNEIPQTCSNDPLGKPVELLIEFYGTPPFHFTVTGQPGNYERHIVSGTQIYSLVVAPAVTTTYTLEMLSDDTRCVTGTFVKSNITVVVTDIDIITPYVEACGSTVDLTVRMINYVKPEAVVTFACATPITVPIIPTGTYSTITVPIPACVGVGIHEIIISIDGCDYNVTVMKRHDGADGSQLIHRRWEGNAEVLVVSNNYTDRESPYFNGGFQFQTYQWYKNGNLIPGANKQYYQDPSGVNGVYYVRLSGVKVDDGTAFEFTTCDQAFNPSLSLKVYPVPAQVDEPVFVELDLTPEEMYGATLEIYDAKGALVKSMPVVSSLTEIAGFKAQGAYYGKITTGTNEIKAVKFLIVK